MRFERTFDERLIRSVVTNPKVYQGVSDDFSPHASLFEPRLDAAIWHIAVYRENELIGLFIIWSQSLILWEIHTCILPTAWGADALEAAREIVPWIWENTTCERLVTNVPAYNVLAYRFALKAGMVQYGVNPLSYRKYGKLWNQYCLGMSKPGAI